MWEVSVGGFFSFYSILPCSFSFVCGRKSSLLTDIQFTHQNSDRQYKPSPRLFS